MVFLPECFSAALTKVARSGLGLLKLYMVILRLVMMVLVDAANGKPRHVPYRDSKLTFLLQVCLSVVDGIPWLKLRVYITLSPLVDLLNICECFITHFHFDATEVISPSYDSLVDSFISGSSWP
jgi:hypothetical protein